MLFGLVRGRVVPGEDQRSLLISIKAPSLRLLEHNFSRSSLVTGSGTSSICLPTDSQWRNYFYLKSEPAARRGCPLSVGLLTEKLRSEWSFSLVSVDKAETRLGLRSFIKPFKTRPSTCPAVDAMATRYLQLFRPFQAFCRVAVMWTLNPHFDSSNIRFWTHS